MATVANTEPPVRIDNINAVISIANVHGANATGTITETVADLLTKGRFSAEIAARMNNFPDLRLKVAPAVGSALANIFKTAADEQLEEFAS